MSDDIRALEARQEALTRELDALVRANQNRRGVLLVEESTVHLKPMLLVLAIAALLGAGVVPLVPHRKPPPMSDDCRYFTGPTRR